jgi:hypothetical protein
VRRLGAELAALVNATVLNRPGNAAFLTGCAQHCGQWAQGQVLGPDGAFNDFNVTIDGTQAVGALQAWYSAPAGTTMVWIQQAAFPCSTCCAGGQV